MIIVADANGAEVRSLLFTEYDFEIGDTENSFLVTCLRSEWETITDGSRIYIPGTEYGGLFKRLKTNTKNGTISVGGYTWRGMLQNKILCPDAGDDYATDSGELNAIIGARVSAAFPGLFVGSNESTGIEVDYQYNRYVTLYDGLKAMLKSVGYKMRISYDMETGKVIVEAVPIVDYSSQIEYSSDMNANYYMTQEGTGVNHLICLGQGELAEREVVHLYVDGNGNISQTQTFYGADEIAQVYDYAGAARNDLIQSGTDQLKQLRNQNSFRMDLETVIDVEIGDIVGGRDYTSGMRMTAPITTKVVTWRNGFETTEYKLSDDVNIDTVMRRKVLSK
ncbi:MAG: hypothetical protein UHU21_12750 [Lachnospiraceae bacterium]|nr:hypothetical protein [Lachnospiraceae bacterium]